MVKQILALVILVVAMVACEKEPNLPVVSEQAARYLTGMGNKVWHLRSIRINDVDQALTGYQSRYTKTYTMTLPNTAKGSFTDSDSYSGEWSMQNATSLQETFQQIGGTGTAQRNYTITILNNNTLTAYYVQNSAKVEETYHAY